jgi:hypothetical protein
MARTYHFELPYSIPGMYVHFGRDRLRNEGLFQQLPPYIQDRFNAAADSWTALMITERDLNAIDDKPWALLARELELNWSA